MFERTIFDRLFNVKTYEKTFGKKAEKNPRKIKTGLFLKYGWFYIGHLKEDDPMLKNKGIRHNQNVDTNSEIQKDEALSHDFNIDGWNDSYFPPIIDQNEKIIDGRGRIRSAIINKQEWIPVAIYSFDYGDREDRTVITNGLKANKHPIAETSKMKSFISGGVSLILDSKQLELDKNKISDWLYNDIEIEDFFNNNSGTITKIIDGIYNRAKLGGEALVNIDTREYWLKWLYMCNELPSSMANDEMALFAEGSTRPMQAWIRHILPRMAEGKMTYIVLYTADEIPSKARDGMKDFDRQLQNFWDLHWKGFENKAEITVNTSKKNSNDVFKILGCIPQLYSAKHENLFRQTKLINVEDY